MNHPSVAAIARASESDDSDVRQHLEACSLCQLAQGAITGHRTEASLVIPKPVPQPIADPAPGQLWRSRWEDAVLFCAVIDVADDEATVLPVTDNLELVPSPPVVWLGDESPLGFDAAVWPGPALTIPIAAFDRYYGNIDDEVPSHGENLAPQQEGGRQLLEHIRTTHAALRDAEWVTVDGTGKPLHERVSEAGFAAQEVGEALDLNPRELGELYQGVRPPTPEEAEILTSRLGIETTHLPATGDAAYVVRELNRPRNRAGITRRATPVERDADTRRRMMGELLQAARTDRGTDPAAYWAKRVAEYLDDDSSE